MFAFYSSNVYNLQVYFGDNLNFRVGEIRYQQTEEDDNTLTQIVIPAAVGGAVLILALLFLIVLCVVIRRFRKKEKESERLFADLQLQLEEMESGLADECKTGTKCHLLLYIWYLHTNILMCHTYVIMANNFSRDPLYGFSDDSSHRKVISHMSVVTTLAVSLYCVWLCVGYLCVISPTLLHIW